MPDADEDFLLVGLKRMRPLACGVIHKGLDLTDSLTCLIRSTFFKQNVLCFFFFFCTNATFRLIFCPGL